MKILGRITTIFDKSKSLKCNTSTVPQVPRNILASLEVLIFFQVIGRGKAVQASLKENSTRKGAAVQSSRAPSPASVIVEVQFVPRFFTIKICKLANSA